MTSAYPVLDVTSLIENYEEGHGQEETITPTPELQAFCHDCEVLSPEVELEQMPPQPLPRQIGEIGTGAVPSVEEKEEQEKEEETGEKGKSEEDSGNGEEHQGEEEETDTPDVKEKEEEEETDTPDVEEGEKEEEKEENEEKEVTEEELIPEEIDHPVDEEWKDKWQDFLKIPEIAAMVTLTESALSAICHRLEPVTAKMYDKKSYPIVDQAFAKLEKLTGAKRENVTYGTMIFLAVYFLVGNLVQITCNIVGFVYPAYRSIKAVRSSSKDDDTEWLIYWVCFAFFSVLDLSMFSAVPFYWLVKVLFLLYLSLPYFKGANYIYEQYVDPGCTLLEAYFTPKEEKEKAN